MTMEAVKIGSATTDDHVDEKITECLDPKSPKSFFLYAGAGSGKTRSLEKALSLFSKNYGEQLRKSGQKIAIITYTNAASDEILERVGNDPLFTISTIHSFCWSQICTFHADIQAWMKSIIPVEIAELNEKQAKGRAGKASLDRERSIAKKTRKLEWLNTPRRFTYNPNGDNFGATSLNHSEVLRITADFIQTKPSMQAVLVNRYPFLLIDESQDTNKHLIDAFFTLEAAQQDKFAIGLFGDMMQRIYSDGKPDLGSAIPCHWEKLVKQMNHRSPRRVVQLGNTLRASIDGQLQLARDDSEQGIVRLFIASSDTLDKPILEQQVRELMAGITSDNDWAVNETTGQFKLEPKVKSLALEHHMAASRMGFADLFASLDQDDKLTDGLRNGTLAGVRLFSEFVAPLIAASRRGDEFSVMAQLRGKTSPLLKRDVLKSPEDPANPLGKIQQAVNGLLGISVDAPATTFMDVLRCVAGHGLFEIPDSLAPFLDQVETDITKATTDLELEDMAREEVDGEDKDNTKPTSLEAWRTFLETPYRQIIPYAEYVADLGDFGTHQGVKGLEFDRVLVIMDDSDARGFMFSYEKVLSAKPLSDRDKKNLAEGNETGRDRTQRLLYVTCTRAKKSLALIAYTDDPGQLEAAVIEQGWFEPSEIEQLNTSTKAASH